ncbi:MAG TPA: hypothetical protein VIM79_10190, partial [Niastella sp.]
MKNLIGLLLTLLVLESCARVNNKKVTSGPLNEGDTSSAPVPTLTADEMSYYKRMVQNHLDSTLGRSRFNGSVLVAKNGQIVFEEYKGFVDPRT